MDKNGFFKAKHWVNLKSKKDKNNSKIINSIEDLKKIIDSEKQKILDNEKLKKIFADLDKKFKNKEVNDFRDKFADKPYIIEKLKVPKEFEKEIFKSYLKELKSDLESLSFEFKNIKKEILNIKGIAKIEKTTWQSVIDEFNERFHVPFVLKIENKEESVLASEVPKLKFIFQKQDQENNDKEIKEEKMLEILSQGEKRAYYILNIIFEIENRKKLNKKQLIVVDDIADSFDYKNKYAIVEYLQEIANYDNFYLLILSHNFDFYRTMRARCNIDKEQSYIAKKEKNEIKLIAETYKNILLQRHIKTSFCRDI